MMRSIAGLFHYLGFEAWVWMISLAFLACIDPSTGTHLSLCLFKNLGIAFCPGCGIGRSISLLLHGHVQQSIYAHPAGIFALPILIHRIVGLIKQSFAQPLLFNR